MEKYGKYLADSINNASLRTTPQHIALERVKTVNSALEWYGYLADSDDEALKLEYSRNAEVLIHNTRYFVRKLIHVGDDSEGTKAEKDEAVKGLMRQLVVPENLGSLDKILPEIFY